MKTPSLFLLLLVSLTGHAMAAESNNHWQSATSASTASLPPVPPKDQEPLATLHLPSAALSYAQEQATPLSGAEIEN
ncbi:hypothetical protein SK355_12975 [Candidatus Fukatsuia symbiotica]|uniref:hypothetical protein n=1 Tax=Candidatus Fukatsuia symbiotica TaxID=1878942 RepID=UPI000E713CAE|nr:hypothetical protein [Candidatus Fukatsuia symbiotica]MEA9446075.1 hypothetical protein [Candidatus Fukatsuia symbiotica]